MEIAKSMAIPSHQPERLKEKCFNVYTVQCSQIKNIENICHSWKKKKKKFRFGKRNVERNVCPASVAKLFHATTKRRTSTINTTNLLGCRQYHHYFDIFDLSNILTSQEANEFHHIKMPLHDRSITIHLLFITGIHNLAENISSNIFVSSFLIQQITFC